MFSNRYSLRKTGCPEKAIPKVGIKRFIYVLKTDFFKIMILNLMFLLFSIPIITLPAAYCAMTKILCKLLREGSCFLWSDYVDEFKNSFVKSFLLGLIWGCIITTFLLVYNAYDIYDTLGYILNAGIVLILFLSKIVMYYAFAMVSMVNLKISKILKNSFYLLLTQYKYNIILLVIPNLLMFLCYYYFPLSIPILIFGAFSILQLLICTIVIIPISKFVLCEN